MLQFKNIPAIYFQNIPDNRLSWKVYYYCRYIKDRPEVRKLITDSKHAYFYCRYVKDRPEIRKNITDSFWKQKYLKWKKEYLKWKKKNDTV